MPYKIVKKDGKHNVINADTKDVKGSHDTHDEAYEQLQAIYASINSSKKHKTAEGDISKMNTLLKAMVAHESGAQSGTLDNKILNQVLTQLIPEVAGKDSIMEGPVIFQQPNETGFVQEGLQKSLWENIISMAYPDLEPTDELINAVAVMELAKLDKPIFTAEDAKNLNNQISFIEASEDIPEASSLQNVLNKED